MNFYSNYPQFKFKWANKKQISDVSQLDSLHFPIPWTEKSWSELSKLNNYFLVICPDNSYFALFLLSPPEGLAHLLKILVVPEERNKGNAQKLFKAAFKALYENGFVKIFLEVEVENQTAIKFYEKNGFDALSLIPNFYGQGRNAQTMLKEMKA